MKKDNAIINVLNIDDQEYKIANENGKEISYSSIIYELFYKRLDEATAKDLYANIMNHKKNMEELLNQKINIITAASNYNSIYPMFEEMRLVEKGFVEELSEIAIYDSLTGLYKRNVFDSLLDIEIDKHKRYGKSLCILMIDVDNFKIVNDKYGHQEGDKVLKELSEVIIEKSRLYDIKCRYGGEEIIIILPTTQKEQAYSIAERLRINVKNYFDNREYKVTISIGIAELHESDIAKDIIHKSDIALYKAKSKGKDQTCTYEEINITDK